MGPVSIVIPADDPERTYTPEEQHRLTMNLLELLEGVHRGAFAHVPLGVDLLNALHANIFRGVRSHAGRCRTADRGSEILIFGPHRSSHRTEVQDKLCALFSAATIQLASLEAHRDSKNFEFDALHFVVRLHADVIWIHPFEDGNGRTGRALMSAMLVRLGLRPIAIDAPKEEYIEALNLLYKDRNIEPLLDLTLGLYPLSENTDAEGAAD